MLINNIEKFKSLYVNNNIFFLTRTITYNVIEYYVTNYTEVNWKALIAYQLVPLSLIEKYKDNIDFNDLFYSRTILTYDFMEKYLYRYNLYDAYITLNKRVGIQDQIDTLNMIIKKYNDKYIIDEAQSTFNKNDDLVYIW